MKTNDKPKFVAKMPQIEFFNPKSSTELKDYIDEKFNETGEIEIETQSNIKQEKEFIVEPNELKILIENANFKHKKPFSANFDKQLLFFIQLYRMKNHSLDMNGKSINAILQEILFSTAKYWVPNFKKYKDIGK